METSREDVSIAIRSAFLRRDTKQRFSLFVLVLLAIVLLFFQGINAKPLNYLRSFVKDAIYRGSEIVSFPARSVRSSFSFIKNHLNLYQNYEKIKDENAQLKERLSRSDFLILENTQLKGVIDEQLSSYSNLVSARVMLDKQSPYLNSFVINIGGNKNIKNGMAVLDGKNFIGRIVDVNFFSSRVLLISDLNSKVPIITEPSGYHAILSGRGSNKLNLEYLPENYKINKGDKVYTSGKEGIFSPGIAIGEVFLEDNQVRVSPYSDISQITFVNIDLGDLIKNK